MPKYQTYGDYDPETKEMMQDCEDEFDLQEYTDDPVVWVVADIINKKEGADILRGYRSDADTEQEAMLGLEPCYPWHMSKITTQEETDEVLNKYAKQLGITAKPDYFTAEYWG